METSSTPTVENPPNSKSPIGANSAKLLALFVQRAYMKLMAAKRIWNVAVGTSPKPRTKSCMIVVY